MDMLCPSILTLLKLPLIMTMPTAILKNIAFDTFYLISTVASGPYPVGGHTF